MNQQTAKNTAKKIAKNHALEFIPAFTVINPPYSPIMASCTAAIMFIIVRVITITGRLSMVARIALRIPKPAPTTIAKIKESARFAVAL